MLLRPLAEFLRSLYDHNCSCSDCLIYLTTPTHIFFITPRDVAYAIETHDKRN